mmetsp:Transcript_98865/g.156392  ORF Transcript_98865/g.156392 Transcript_98865/m.156392 type:complete len:215 (-) Transcript_98865:638-1282(-)
MKLRVLSNSERASSPVKMAKVSAIALISSLRTLLRLAYSASSDLQPSTVSAKKFWSASSVFVVVSKSSFAFATLSNKAASSASFASFCLVVAAISAFLAAASFWNAIRASSSSFCAAAKFFANLSPCVLRIPRMLPLRALYDLAPAAAPIKSFGLASLPNSSSVFTHGRSFPCASTAASFFGRNTSPRKDPVAKLFFRSSSFRPSTSRNSPNKS